MNDAEAIRPCPFCATEMASRANLCSHCRRFSTPTEVISGEVQANASFVDILNQKAARWEHTYQQGTPRTAATRLRLPLWLRVTFMVGLAAYAAFTFFEWAESPGGLCGFLGALSLLTVAVFVGLYSWLVKPSGVREGGLPRADVAIRLFGLDTNLAVIQMISVLTMFFFFYHGDTGWASGAAIVAISVGGLILSTSHRSLAITFSVLAAIVLAVIWLGGTLLPMWRIQMTMWQITHEKSPLLISVLPYMALCVTIAAFPVLQIIRYGNIGFGRMKGDFHISIFGSSIPIAITTSILVISLIASMLHPFKMQCLVWTSFL